MWIRFLDLPWRTSRGSLASVPINNVGGRQGALSKQVPSYLIEALAVSTTAIRSRGVES